MHLGGAHCVFHIVDKEFYEMPAADLDVEKAEAIESDPLAARFRFEIQFNFLVVKRRGNPAIATRSLGVVVERPATRFVVGRNRDAIFGISARLFRGCVNRTEAMPEIGGIVDRNSKQRFLRLCGRRVWFKRMVWP